MSEKRRLQIPQGTEAFFQEEAKRHRRYTAELEVLFQLWGYLPVKTPAFDFYDTYRPLIDPRTEGRIYRLIDREGELLMLRSDITLFLAKQISTSLRAEDLPLRVYYSDTILRYQHHEDISRNEFYQVGLELIGKPGMDGDAEALVLLDKCLSVFGDASYRVHIGSRAVIAALFTDTLLPAAVSALAERDFATLRELGQKAGYTNAAMDAIQNLLGFIGKPIELANLIKGKGYAENLPAGALAACSYIIELFTILDRLDLGGRFLIDISEIGMQSYYSGIAFQAYLRGADSSIAAGGRYDGLLDFFGFSAASVGFSILQRKIEAILPEERASAAKPELVTGIDFVDAYGKAEKIRRQGRSAVL